MSISRMSRAREQHPTLTLAEAMDALWVRLAFLEAVDCHKRRPYQGRARYHHEKRYCS